jgi:hypothetical protein
MELRFQPALIQDVIDAFIEKTEREGDPTFYKEFHELADPVYENFPLDEREPEFSKLYQYLFGKWGFADVIMEAFDEFPDLRNRIGITLVRGVLKENEEAVDVLRKWGTVEEELAKSFEAKGLKGVGIKLLPRRFYDPALGRFCRHELLHIKDVLDPHFLYDPNDTKVGSTPGEEALILSRYRVLWCLTIDSRLTRAGKEPVYSKEQRFHEFSTWYRKIPGRQLVAVFEGLWTTEFFTHPELIEMAADTLKVLDRAIEVEGGEITERKTVMLMPGFPCPLCGFPTYNWVENIAQEVEPGVLEYIRENHPGWDPEYGGCDRCIEVYKLRAAGVMGD